MDTFSVVMLDDHLLFVEGMKAVLNSIEEIGKVYVASEIQDLFPVMQAVHPNLLLLDLNLKVEDGLQVVARVKEEYPSTKILVLTSYSESKYVKKAFSEGVDGYILKDASREELVEGVQEVLSGEIFLGNGVHLPNVSYSRGQDRQQSEYTTDDRFIQKNNLTRREIEILGLIGEAMSNKEIAKVLFISDQTVSVHKKNLMRKLGVNNTASLVKIAFQSKLVK